MTREEAIRHLEAAKLMLLGNDNQPISDLYYALDMAIKALKQEPCEDAISRQEVIDAIDKWVKVEHILEILPTDKVTPLFKSVHKLPPVNPQYTENEIQKMQDLEQAEIEKAYELGKAESER